MWCRVCNRVFNRSWVRRSLSVPRTDNQRDVELYLQRCRTEDEPLLERFGRFGEVSGRRVLDVGCGLGAHSVAAARAGAAETIGVDNDLEKIRQARQLADRESLSGVSFAVQDGAELAFDEGRFDVVMVLDVIEHVAHPAALLGECARVLRSGGVVLLSFPPYRSPWGAHLFTHVPIPWVQLMFPDREVLGVWRQAHRDAVSRGAVKCSAKRMRAIMEANDTAGLWDCNGLTISGFFELVDGVPLTVDRIRFKVIGNLGGWVMRSSRMREYLVTRVTAVLGA